MNLSTRVYKITQRDDIQIYRGIAVIAVLLYHFGYYGANKIGIHFVDNYLTLLSNN